MSEEKSFLTLAEKYFSVDPRAAANSLETMQEEEVVAILLKLPAAVATDAVSRLSDALAAAVLKKLPEELFLNVVDGMEAEQLANIFLRIPEEMRRTLLSRIQERKRKLIRDILTFPEDSAGRIMSTDFLAFHTDILVKDAVKKIRELSGRGTPAFYVYVVDPQDHLIGVLNMRDMLLAPEAARLEEVMRQDIFSVDCFMDREQVANELESRRFFAVPVVDPENRLIGVVKSDQLIGDVKEEASEDIQKMFGAGADERVFSPISFSIRKRLPWLHVNLVTCFLAASVVALFEDVIAKITILAVFLPVVAGQGGNAGAQSLVVVMRGIVMREIPPEKVKKLILKEATLGALNGLIIGTVTAAVTWAWGGNPFLGLVIGLGMFVTLIVAGLSGAAIPIVMKAIGLDPAQCSSIILTTVTDVVGFFSFLGFAVLFQAYLL